MKRLYTHLLAAALLIPAFMSVTSCDDDDGSDLPDVEIKASFSGAYCSEGILYVVSGDDLVVDALTLTDHTSKGAVIGSATYIWDGRRYGASIVSPYGMEFGTAGVSLGRHVLQIQASVYAVDYPPCTAILSYRVEIVAEASAIPDGAVPVPDTAFYLTHEDVSE